MTSYRLVRSFACALLLAAGLFITPRASLGEEKPVLRVVYFTPAEREPIEGYQERVDRLMTHVQGFYRDEMQRLGFGPMTFDLERDEDGKLVIYLVQGKETIEAYGRNSLWKIRGEVAPKLAEKGIDVNRETLMLFTTLLSWEGKVAKELGPYCGTGNHLTGTATAYDDALLDPKALSSKEPGGYYHRPCSIGKFNSHYIGGITHELGHGLGLPHVKQTRADKKTALMGSGNHTYGTDLRGQGTGTFLTMASGLMLSQHRLFAGKLPEANQPTTLSMKELEVTHQEGTITLKGKVESDPPVYGLIVYNDNAAIRSNYDAVGWTTRIGEDDRFEIRVGDLHPGTFQLGLRFCHKGGRSTVRRATYTLERDKPIETDALRDKLLDKK